MYPILFELGPITVFSLWLFIAAGFAAGSFIFVRLAKRNRLKLTLISDNAFFLFFITLIVSRIIFVSFNTDLYFYQFKLKSLLAVLTVWDKGFSFWGAIGGFLGGVLYLAKRYSESPLRLLDAIMPAILIGMAFGNIGALLEGINYGTPTNLPWGVTFRSANVKYVSPIHPTQIYSALYALALAGFSYALFTKLRGRLAGFATEATVFLFGLFKFFEEFLRGDETAKILDVRLPQILAFFGMAAAAYLIFRRYTNKTGGDPEFILKKFTAKIFPRKQRTPNSAKMSAKAILAQNQTA